jgi:hypothetical protein
VASHLKKWICSEIFLELQRSDLILFCVVPQYLGTRNSEQKWRHNLNFTRVVTPTMSRSNPSPGAAAPLLVIQPILWCLAASYFNLSAIPPPTSAWGRAAGVPE